MEPEEFIDYKETVADLDPQEYFDYVKKKIKKINKQELNDFYEGCLALVDKYKTTGQMKILDKIKFLVDCVEKEKQLIDMGIDKYVYRDDIEDYIDNIASDVVKIIEIENYPRDIPDEIVEVVGKTKDIFDRMYIVFTDYTGKVEKQVEEDRRRKDPILFGTFQEIRNNLGLASLVNDRFYYLGDWEDEYCDLTLDKFLREAGREKIHTAEVPVNNDEILMQLENLCKDFREKEAPIKAKKKKVNILYTLKRWIGIED